MSAYSFPTTNQLLEEIAASHARPPDYDPQTMVTSRQLAARLQLRESRARQILNDDHTLEKIEVVLPNGHRGMAWRKKGESTTDSPA